MTNLAYKYGFKLYREADDSGEPERCGPVEGAQDRELYPQLFMQTNPTDYIGKRVSFAPEGSIYANIK
jgi:hypothetical protein